MAQDLTSREGLRRDAPTTAHRRCSLCGVCGSPVMLGHEFIRNAYLAGTLIALACGVVGWFTVLRGQVFAGDALSHVAFVGAIAAAVVGVDERVGLFALT